MPWLYAIIKDGERIVTKVQRPSDLITTLYRVGAYDGNIRDEWTSKNSDKLIHAIEADPRQDGYHYTKLFERWFTDYIRRNHMPVEGQDYVVEGKTLAIWRDA